MTVRNNHELQLRELKHFIHFKTCACDDPVEHISESTRQGRERHYQVLITLTQMLTAI